MKNIGLLLIAAPYNGGTYQYTLSVIEACKCITNHNITIYTTADNNHYDDVGYPVKKIKGSRWSWPLLSLANLLRIKIADPFKEEDLIISPIHSPLLLHTKTKFIFTLHDLQEHYYPEYFSFAKRTWRKFINTRLCDLALFIFCESNYVKNDISKFFGINQNKIVVIPSPPINLNKAEKEEVVDVEEVIKKHALPKKYLFYPAQFWLHKNHSTLIKAFKRIADKYDDVYLVLTGQKKYEYKNVTKEIESLQLENRVKHLGFVEQEHLAIVYKKAIALVLPTLFESISIPIYEAFQLGVPVCSSNVVSLPEQVGDAGILFDPLSIDSIENALITIIDDKALRTELSVKGTVRISSITYQSYANKLEKLIDSI